MKINDDQRSTLSYIFFCDVIFHSELEMVSWVQIYQGELNVSGPAQHKEGEDGPFD